MESRPKGYVNAWPSGYEPDELPDCPTPRRGEGARTKLKVVQREWIAVRVQYVVILGDDWRWCYVDEVLV